MRFLIPSFVLVLLSSVAAAEAKIAAWNLAGFHPVSSKNLGNAVDVIETIDADVILLVEVNTAFAGEAVAATLSYRGNCHKHHTPEQPRASQEITLVHKCDVDVSNVGLIDGSDLDKRGYRQALHANVKVGEFDFVLVGLHLKAGRGSSNRNLRNQQVDVIANWIDANVFQTAEKDVLVIGDYNMIPRSDISNFERLSDGKLLYVSSTDLPPGTFSHIKSSGAGSLLDGYAISETHTSEYITDSVEVLRTDHLTNMGLSKFREDVSDHRPIIARFNDSTDDD